MTPHGPTIWKTVQENDEMFAGGARPGTIWGIITNVMELEAVLQGQKPMGQTFPRLRKVPETIFGCKIVGVLVIIWTRL